MPDAKPAPASLADRMALYAAWHNDATSRAIHYVFVPVLVWGVFGLLGSLGGIQLGEGATGFLVTLAHVVALLLLGLYLRLDFPYGVAMVALFTVGLVNALHVAASAGTNGILLFGAIVVLAYLAQLVAHHFIDGRPHGFVDNLTHLVWAPLFIVAEWSFSLGFRKALQEEVARKMLVHIPMVPEEQLPGRPLKVETDEKKE